MDKPKVIVQLTKSYLNINAGEIAGFDPDTARQLVTQNAAVLVGEPTEASTAVPPVASKGKK